MKYLFSDWGGIEKALKGKFIYLFLDYDGTLAPITATPGKASMAEKTKNLLRQLSKMPDCKIAIISGRSLKDISSRIGLKGIVYVGNHGFEIKGPKINYTSVLPLRYRKTLEEIKNKLTKNLSSIKGAFIEDKGLSLALHYRLADKADITKVKTEFYAALLSYEIKDAVWTKTGKMVLEVRPPVEWGKGKVVLWLLGRRIFVMRNKKMKTLPLYIGDDTTDEDAFEALKNRGITIFVGKPRKTSAQFYLKNTREVDKFLRLIWKNRKR